jgi:hypothetical protein
VNSAKTRKASNKPRQRFNLDPSVQKTLFLLGLVFTVGALSGAVGYWFARQSLKGVTQPAANPFLNDTDQLNRRPRQGADFLSEKDLIAKVKSQTSSPEATKRKKASSQLAKQDANSKSSSQKAEDAKLTTQSFPIKVQNQGVNLEIRSLIQEEDTLVLKVALQNTGNQTVQFVYTFLDITDDQGQALFSEIRGLPTEFKPKGETFFGTIKILDVPPESVKTLSLSLNDYPDQNVKLDVQNIPVLD